MTNQNTTTLTAGPEFSDFIANYDFQFPDGWFDVSAFATYLEICLTLDRKATSVRRSDILDLLNKITNEFTAFSEKEFSRTPTRIARREITDWTPEMSSMYPDGYAIVAHVATLTSIRSEWISRTGGLLPDTKQSTQSYFGWVPPEWKLTKTLLQGFHDASMQFEQSIDLRTSRDTGYSTFEALSQSLSLGITYDEAIEKLKRRNANLKTAQNRISKAIVDGYPLEAITISESLICACMHHFATSAGKQKLPSMFSSLTNAFRDLEDKAHAFPVQLVDEIDAWRRARNDAMHLFVSRDLDQVEESQAQFLGDATATALQGKDLCSRMIEWFEIEAVHLVNNHFTAPDKPLP